MVAVLLPSRMPPSPDAAPLRTATRPIATSPWPTCFASAGSGHAACSGVIPSSRPLTCDGGGVLVDVSARLSSK